MKDISESHVMIVDAGAFLPLAEMFGKVAKRTSYYTPWESEYLEIGRCVIGDGMPGFDRVDEPMDPDFFDTVDLWCFPDIGYGGFQRYLRRLGKPVWGSMGASDMELYRTRFLDVLKRCGLPMVNSVKLRGVTALGEHLKGVEDKWVKINRYRENMETWHHIDYQHSARELERLAYVFGPLKEHVVFVVQDTIKGDEGSPVMEVGFDGWFVTSPDGQPQWPVRTYQGYEAKNQLYLGSQLAYKELPEEIRMVNEAIAPELVKYGYRNFFATELRIKDGVANFIDPTARMAGQTMEHLLNTCKNLPQIILAGASGEILAPEFTSTFAAEATMHYKGDSEGWKTFKPPESIADKVKLYRCCFADGAYQFPPHKCDELGVIIGNGETIEESIEDLKANFEELKDEPVSIDPAGFADLLRDIQAAEDEGVKFSDEPVPAPEAVLAP